MAEISAAESRLESLSSLTEAKDILYNPQTQSYSPNKKSYGIIELLTGAISFKAWLFPNSAKQIDRKATANQILKDLSEAYGLNKNSINALSMSLSNNSQNFIKPISSKLVNGISFQAKEYQACPDKNLAAALFNNQFRKLTEIDTKLQEGIDDITALSRKLHGEYNLTDRSEMAGANIIFNKSKLLSQPSILEYDAVTPEKLAAYCELGQITSDFKKNVLPNLQRNNNEATGAPSVQQTLIDQPSQSSNEKAFDTALKNFLDDHPNISSNDLKKYLTRYSNRYTGETANSSTSSIEDLPESSSTNKDDLSDINSNLRSNTSAILAYSSLTKEISEIRRTRDYEKCFKLLSDLNNQNISFKSTDGKNILDEKGRSVFINSLLEAFTIRSSKIQKGEEIGNPQTSQFFIGLGQFLAETENSPSITPEHQQKATRLLKNAEQVLDADGKRREETTTYMKAVKNYVENQRKAGAPIEKIPENKIDQPLLSHDALDLLNKAIGLLTPPLEPTPDQLA